MGNGRMGRRASERKEKVSGWVGRRADGRVEEASGWQGGVTGLMEALGGLGSLGDSGGLVCWVCAATTCQDRLCHGATVRVTPNPKQ